MAEPKPLNVPEFTAAWCADELTIEQLADLYGSNVDGIRTVARHLGLPRRNARRGPGISGGRWVLDPRRRVQVWQTTDDPHDQEGHGHRWPASEPSSQTRS